MRDDMDGTPDPITELAAAAALHHELFLSYAAAGFTEPQALYLVGKIITAGIAAGDAPGGAE
jgi:hypothetical protein